MVACGSENMPKDLAQKIQVLACSALIGLADLTSIQVPQHSLIDLMGARFEFAGVIGFTLIMLTPNIRHKWVYWFAFALSVENLWVFKANLYCIQVKQYCLPDWFPSSGSAHYPTANSWEFGLLSVILLALAIGIQWQGLRKQNTRT